MQKRINTTTFVFLLICQIAFSQKQGNIWLFGEGGGLNFNSGNPVSFSGGQVYGMPTQTGDFPYTEGCTSISDSSGALLFYSNGGRVWNVLHQVMPHGDGLMGFSSSSSAAFAIPKPGSDSLFYLFTTDGIEHQLRNGLRYSMINMCLDDGKGDVEPAQKNMLLLDTVSEKLCAIAHPNGTDIWLVAHKYHSSLFYAYRITATGISAPVITNIGSVHTATTFATFGAAIGQMKASPDGSMIALSYSNVNPSVIELFNFNAATGLLSNAMSLMPESGEDGVEFSPDNSKLYISSIQGVHQFDLSTFNQSAINASKLKISIMGGSIPSELQLGPNGKIYYAKANNSLSVINNPNALGYSCNFSVDAVPVGAANHCISLPLFIAGYKYKNKSFSCRYSTSGTREWGSDQFSIYPNPSNGQITIKQLGETQTADKIEIFNNVGQLVFTQKLHASELTLETNLPKGIYYYAVSNSIGQAYKNKLVVE